MDLETLLNSLPVQYERSPGIISGLCIQYKVNAKQWIAFYGTKRSGILDKKEMKWIGIGETPYDALKDFIKKIRSWNKAG